MNDFTKDELLELLFYMRIIDDEETSLENKIQAMYENYCEHENISDLTTFLSDAMIVKIFGNDNQ